MNALTDGKQKAVLAWIERNQDDLVRTLQRLVQIPSVYPNEAEAQALVRERFCAVCDRTDVWEPDPVALEAHPAYFAKGRSFKGRPNVVGVLEGTGEGRSLLLNAHIDVVPPQPDAEWPHGPWSGAIHAGKIFGRGSLDDKSGTAIMITVATALRQTGVKLRGTLQLHSVVDEEWGGAGTLASVQRGYHADGAIILEPVGSDIYPASRGGQAFRVQVRGKGTHPGASWKGVSALDKAIVLLQGLKRLEADRNEKLRTPLFSDYPVFAPIVIGTISADNIPSKVPEECIFEGLLGFPPQEHWSEARVVFEQFVAETASRDGWLAQHPPVVSWPGLNKEGAEIPVDHPLVQCLQEAVTQLTGKVPRVTGFPAGTDLPLLVLHGSIPAVLHGVECDWEHTHSSSEHVDLRSLLQGTQRVALAVMRWCGLEE